jgi:hypothetical protein
MPLSIQCPACKRKLNVPDKVAGKRVKCPGCGVGFLAKAPESEFVEPEVVETEAVAVPVEDDEPDDKPRRRPRDDDDERVSAKPQRRRPREEDEDDERVSSRPQGRRKSPRDDDEDEEDDRQRKRRRSRDEVDDEDDDRPRRRRRRDEDDDDDYGIRRRREPHRGALILTLGIITIPAGLCCALPGLIMGAITTNLARADFIAMKSGHMDRSGHALTMAGNICAMVGIVISLLNCVATVVLQMMGVLHF